MDLKTFGTENDRPSEGTGSREFDEEWYLAKYDDVRTALRRGSIASGQEHFYRYGKTEGREARFKGSHRPIIHLHVAKTAGTSLHGAFLRSGMRVLSIGPEFEYLPARHGEIDVFTGHFGYRVASSFEGDIITILRDPVDRFISYYYYLVQSYDNGSELTERTVLAKHYSIDDFVYLQDHPHLITDLFNCVVWQLAYGNSFEDRMAFRKLKSPTDDELLATAIENMRRFSIVGFQSDLPRFVEKVSKRYKLQSSPERENATANRPAVEAIATRTRKKIEDWLYLDTELFRWAQTAFKD